MNRKARYLRIAAARAFVRATNEAPEADWEPFVRCRTLAALAIRVKRRLNSSDVIEVLAELMLARGPPSRIRSDNVLCWERKAA